MPKVFISHSSIDKDIVRLFKDIILKEGVGLSDADIFFTSSPETGVPIGENIPQYIKNNLMQCDFAFLMISENYKKSEVCLNEMGAAMVLGKKLFPILLYNYDFDKVGWLIDRDLCARIDDEERLDEIRDVFNSNGIASRTSVWNRARNTFVHILSQNEDKSEDVVIKGLLDYQIEINDSQEKYKKNVDCLNAVITDSKNTADRLIETHNASFNIQERKQLLKELASVLNKWADEMECLVPVVLNALMSSINPVAEIIKMESVSSEDKEGWIKEITGFQEQCKDNRKTVEHNRQMIQSQAEMLTEQIVAKNRVLKGYDSLFNAYDIAVKKINEIISMR